MNNIVNKENTLNKLLNGINQLTNEVKTTSGSKGKTYLIRRPDGSLHITKDGVTIAKAIECEDSVEQLGVTMLQQAAQQTVDQHGDAPQPLYAKVLTPTGYTTMGELKLGQVICGTKGTHQVVTGIFPQGKKEIYEVHLKDGRIVECSEDHLWSVYYMDCNDTRVLQTRELIDAKRYKKTLDSYVHKYFIPNTYVEFTNQDLPIDPYLMGLLIGDGSLSGTGQVELSLGKPKEHILSKISKAFPFRYIWYDNKNYYRVKFDSKIKQPLKEIGLFGTKSKTKFIPKMYLMSSLEQRKALLQGLIDTDGHINNRGKFEFATTSVQLKEDFIELCRSLGIPLNIKTYVTTGYKKHTYYRITELNGYKGGFPIEKIVATGKKTDMQCIKVSNPDHLYITDNYVITHNTTSTITIAQALAEQINKALETTESRQLLREVDETLTLILKELKKQAYKVSSLKDCIRVATIATNNDDELGELIGTVVWEAKENGVILFEESEKTYTEVIQEQGSKYQRSYEWKKFLGKNEIRTAFENPLIHIFENDVQSYDMIAYSIKESFDTNRPLILMAPDYAKFVINELYRQYQAGVKILPLLLPGYGDEVAEYRKDIEAIVANDNVYRVMASKFDFTLYTKSYTQTMQDRTNYVLNQIGNEPTQYYKEILERRLSILNQKVFTIHVGAPSNVEMLELKDRMEDGLLATRSAYEEGYVLGGGIALRNVFHNLATVSSEGGLCALKSIISPYIQIIKNAGYEYQLLEGRFGIDTNTGKVTDFKKAGIYDSYGAIRQATINAFSVIKTIIQLNGTILDNNHQKKVQFVPNEGFAEV